MTVSDVADDAFATITLRNPCGRSLAPLSVNALVDTGRPILKALVDRHSDLS